MSTPLPHTVMLWHATGTTPDGGSSINEQRMAASHGLLHHGSLLMACQYKTYKVFPKFPN